VFLDDVVVVEQPFARRPDVDLGIRGGGQAPLRVVEDAAAAVEPCEQRGRPPAAARGGEPLDPRDRLRPLREAIDAEQVAADRPGEQVLTGIRAPREDPREEAAESGLPDRRRQNCAASVDPCSAVVEAAPPATNCVTSSKYPVPTSRWCRVAV